MTDSNCCTNRFWLDELMKDIDNNSSSSSCDDEYDIDEENILSLQHPTARRNSNRVVVQSKSVFKSSSLASSSSTTTTLPIKGELQWTTSSSCHGTSRYNPPILSKDEDVVKNLSSSSCHLVDSTEHQLTQHEQGYVPTSSAARPTLSVSLYSGTIPSISTSSSVKTVTDETEDDNFADDDDLMIETTDTSIIEVDVDGSDCRIDDSERVSNQSLSESDHSNSHCSVIDPSYQLLAMIGSYDDDHDDEMFTTTRNNNVQDDNNNYQDNCNLYNNRNNPKEIGFRCYIFQDDNDNDSDKDLVDNLHELDMDDVTNKYQYTTFPTPSSVANDCAIECTDSNDHSKTNTNQKQRMTIKSMIDSTMRKLLQPTSSTNPVTTTDEGASNTTPMNVTPVTASSFYTLLQAIHDNCMDGTYSNDTDCHHISSISTIMEVSTSSNHENSNNDENVNWNDHSFCVTESTDSSSCCSSSTSSSSSYRASCKKDVSCSSSDTVAIDECYDTKSDALSDSTTTTTKSIGTVGIIDGSVVSLVKVISNVSTSSINHHDCLYDGRYRKSPLALPIYHQNCCCCCDVQYDDWYYRNVIRTMYHVAYQLSSILPQKTQQVYYY